jgi:hypothetical protein
MPPARRSAIVIACGIVVGIAAAGRRARADAADDAVRMAWGPDVTKIGGVFHFVDAKDDAAFDLSSKSTISCTPIVDVSETEAVLQHAPLLACTGTLATGDEDTCRMAAVIRILLFRQNQLLGGDDRSFTFALTCQSFVMSGTLTAYGAFLDHVDGSLRLRTETPDGDVRDSDIVPLTWAKQPPDPARPAQWKPAVLQPLVESRAALGRLQHVLAAAPEDVDAVSHLIADELASAQETTQGFPAGEGADDDLRAAAIAWLVAEQADLDHGDLRQLVDRAAVAHPNAAYKRKTKAIAARFQKAEAKRLRAVSQAIDRFDHAHDLH